MSDVFIVSARRTPFGSFGGTLATVPAPQLAAQVIRFILAETGLPATAIDEVIIGQVLQGGSGQAPARQAMRLAGIPDSAHAMTINKVCGSGLKSIALGASASFLTPIGYQTNTMVYGPGGYRFGDYARLGTPLTLVMIATIVLLVPVFWPA